MKLLRPSSTAVRVAMVLACTAAFADEPAGTPAAAPAPREFILVNRTRDPVNKSYRRMLDGMALFEKMHAMAPNASLRFKLLPRQRDTKRDGIVPEIIGDTVTVPVALAADRTFTLVHDQEALDENASVIPNRKASSMTWRAEIRTPGLPPNTRRLGDLRLECRVGIESGLVSNTRPVIGLIADLIQGMLDFCDGSDVPYLFFSERPLFGVTMIAGARREILSVDDLYAGISHGRISKADLAYCDCQVLLDRTYFLPLGDKSWPDDTLIEFEYMDDGIGPRLAAAPSLATGSADTANTLAARKAADAVAIGSSTEAELIAFLGKTTVVAFDSGYEVWVYQIIGDRVSGDTAARASWVERILHGSSEQETSRGKCEFVILFEPSRVVTKTRIRPAPAPGAAKVP